MSFNLIPPEEMRAITLKAIAEGRHSRVWRFFCELCQTYQDKSFGVTFDGKKMCEGCADRLGCGPKQFAEREIEKQRRIARLHA